MTPLHLPITCPLSPHIIDHDLVCPICRGHSLSVTIYPNDRLYAELQLFAYSAETYRRGVSDGLLAAYKIAERNESPFTLQPSLAVLTP